MRLNIPLVAVCATLVSGSFLERRSTVEIENALTDINGKLQALDTLVKGYTQGGSPAPLIAASDAVLAAIKAGTTAITPIAPLIEAEAIAVATSIGQLSSFTSTVVDDFIAKKAAIVADGQGGTVLKGLNDQKAAAIDFGTALISKVPDSLKSIGEGLQAEINAALQRGIDAFTGTGPPPGSSSSGAPPPSSSSAPPPSSSSGSSPPVSSSSGSAPPPSSSGKTTYSTVTVTSTSEEPCESEPPSGIPPPPPASSTYVPPKTTPPPVISTPSPSLPAPPASYTAGAARVGASVFALGVAAIGLMV